mmetsp:Transcript_34121/g.98235  ORF Transcript_34121/g.98235 Transcript_34121/m.98235 type:complete len:201 (+) Transcript_34121:647-1249(+)
MRSAKSGTMPLKRSVTMESTIEPKYNWPMYMSLAAWAKSTAKKYTASNNTVPARRRNLSDVVAPCRMAVIPGKWRRNRTRRTMRASLSTRMSPRSEMPLTCRWAVPTFVSQNTGARIQLSSAMVHTKPRSILNHASCRQSLFWSKARKRISRSAKKKRQKACSTIRKAIGELKSACPALCSASTASQRTLSTIMNSVHHL